MVPKVFEPLKFYCIYINTDFCTKQKEKGVSSKNSDSFCSFFHVTSCGGHGGGIIKKKKKKKYRICLNIAYLFGYKTGFSPLLNDYK